MWDKKCTATRPLTLKVPEKVWTSIQSPLKGARPDQINSAVQQTAKIIESVQIRTAEGLGSVAYPETAIHEIVTNSVLHRDYSIADDVHIKIFDNRVEVLSRALSQDTLRQKIF